MLWTLRQITPSQQGMVKIQISYSRKCFRSCANHSWLRQQNND